jgi:hypothetical protein
MRGEQASGDQKKEDRGAGNEHQNDSHRQGHHACNRIENAPHGRFSGCGLAVLSIVRLEALTGREELERVPVMSQTGQ